MYKDMNGYAAEVDKLKALAKSFGLTDEETGRIFQAVNEKAEASLSWGTVQDRITDIRNRIYLARR